MQIIMCKQAIISMIIQNETADKMFWKHLRKDIGFVITFEI